MLRFRPTRVERIYHMYSDAPADNVGFHSHQFFFKLHGRSKRVYAFQFFWIAEFFGGVYQRQPLKRVHVSTPPVTRVNCACRATAEWRTPGDLTWNTACPLTFRVTTWNRKRLYSFEFCCNHLLACQPDDVHMLSGSCCIQQLILGCRHRPGIRVLFRIFL